ncbi:MAG: MFS transporter [Opitutaceae bacterium]
MRCLRLHFFLTYGIMGSIMPFFPVYLREVQSLSSVQIGTVMAVASLAVLITPVLFTWLADLKENTRNLASGIFLVSATATSLLFLSRGFGWTLLLYGLQSLALVPMLPLQDGLYFRVARSRTESGLATPPFHQIRVWGTIGFISPSIVLFAGLRAGATLNITLIAAAVFAVAGLINSRFLPESERRRTESAPGENASRLPTVAAARVLFRPPVVFFCAGMAILQFAVAGYYSFYPIYLTEVAGIESAWLGLISNIGVTVEIFFMLGFGWLSSRLGIRRIIVLGAMAITVRMAALAFLPGAGIAIGVQLFHGWIIIATLVAPVVYLNRLAGDTFRNSIQGLYAMVIAGLFRILGNLFFGQVAERSLTAVFLYGAILSIIATVLFTVAFREKGDRETSARERAPADPVSR